MIERFTAEQARKLTSVDVQYARVIERIKQSAYNNESFVSVTYISESVNEQLLLGGFKVQKLKASIGANSTVISW